VTPSAQKNAFIVRLFDADSQPVVSHVRWYWPFASEGHAVFAGTTTVTMDLGPRGVGAVQLVCGVTPGQQTSTAWGSVPFSPPLVYQNVTVTVLDPAPDADGDGCSNAEELGNAANVGGQRDPLDSWDFFDVTGEGAIDLSDALTILNSFGLVPEDAEYNDGLDRVAPNAGKPWQTAPAAGDALGIDLQDALLNLQSFGHSCA
jgi:hypothetical protein